MKKNKKSNIPKILRYWLADFNQNQATPIDNLTISRVREGLEVVTRMNVTRVPELAYIQDSVVKTPSYSIPVRIYHPRPAVPLSVSIFIHGGGHVAGNIEAYDPIARKLAIATDTVLVSVDYRLAPEFPYPAAINDVMEVIEGIDTLLSEFKLPFIPKLALIGDSGGGALCATVSHHYQKSLKVQIERQVLIYPSLDYTLSHPSIEENATGYLLESAKINWMFNRYFQNGENREEASPLFMPITPNYPRTLIITAEYCPLRDEGQAYARRLRDAGVRCELEYYDGMIHAFLNLEDLAEIQCLSFYQRLSAFFGNEEALSNYG